MDFFNLDVLLAWVAQHPYWSGAAVFVISVAESLAIVGLFIPGTIVMFGIGALVASGALELWTTLGYAAAGAVLGDSLSYWLGRHYHERLRAMWPFKRYPQALARGEHFFHRHGGKSVVLGRFVGPIRPIIPVVAGMMNMAPARFLAVNVLSALLWAPAYTLPGVVFGASLGLASAVASRLAVLVVMLLLVLWLSVWGVRTVMNLLHPYAEALIVRLLAWSRAHHVLGRVTAALVDPQHPESPGLIIWAAVLLLAAALFLEILQDVVFGDPLVRLDSTVFYVLQGLRTPWADQVMVFITELGDKQVLLPLVVTVLVALLALRHWQAALHWLAATVFGALLTQVLKQVLHVARPVSLYQGASSFAFPSSHATMSLVVYGFLAVLIARELPPAQRWLPYAGATVLIVAISISRLYLGAHWLSDVLGGLSLGLAWVALLGIAYRRHLAPKLPARLLLTVALATLVIAASWHVAQRHAADVERYALKHPLRTMQMEAWWQHGWQSLPAYRIDLQGQSKQALNLQWAGSLSDLRKRLEAHGWRAPVALNLASTLHWLVPDAQLAQLPVLPQVHDGRHEELLMVRPSDARPGRADQQWVLRLWAADTVLIEDLARGATDTVHVPGKGAGLWLGSITRQYVGHPLPVLSLARSQGEVAAPMKPLQALLEDVSWRWVQRHVPASLANTDSNEGGVLLIR